MEIILLRLAKFVKPRIVLNKNARRLVGCENGVSKATVADNTSCKAAGIGTAAMDQKAAPQCTSPKQEEERKLKTNGKIPRQAKYKAEE